MPAPDLTPQTPGEPLATSTIASAVSQANAGNPNASETDTANAQPPLYVAKHNGGGRWIVATNDDKQDRVGDFVGDKESIKAEVDRMNAGGEPYTKPADTANAQDSADSVAKIVSPDIDATTLKQAVMTPEGWLCPEPVVKG